MGFAVFDKTTKRLVGWGANGVPFAVNAIQHRVLMRATKPNKETERLNDTEDDVRPATAQEQSDAEPVVEKNKRALRAKADNAPVSVKDLKDLGWL